MKKIKIIVEIDEQYIYEHADVEKFIKSSNESDRGSALESLGELMSFAVLKSKVEKGATEFVINSDTISPEGENIFRGTIPRLAALAGTIKEDK